MSKLISFLFILFLVFRASAQDSINISFDVDSTKVSRTASNQIIPIKLNINKEKLKTFGNYSLDIVVDNRSSTLSQKEYALSTRKILFDDLNKTEEIFVRINKDSLPGRDRTIILNMKFTRNDSIKEILNEGKNRVHTITVAPVKSKLNGYEYLGYVGTNFDLVEGVQAKDLFFAANILNRPERNIKKNVGFYLSIYGNRAFSRSDSTGVIQQRQIIDTIGENYRVINRSGMALETETTDNLGVYVSPLFQWPFKQNEGSKTNIYYAPSLEFVYRRTRLSRSRINFNSIDTTSVNIELVTAADRLQVRDTPNVASSETFNEFSFNAGVLGLFLVHETDRISVRVHGSVGYSSNYTPNRRSRSTTLSATDYDAEGDIFFTGRAWITEPKSGLTLQAEVTNLLFNPRPFFVATLSKAFDFKDLGNVFRPITARD